MIRNTTKVTAIGVTVLLVAALTLPATAFAGSGTTGGSGVGSTSAMAASGSDALRTRVAEALQRRAERFDNALQTMERRRERIMELADVVEAAGGDVAQVRTMLQECERLMTQAREQEQVAAQMFRDVPDAGDRRGAFVQARTQARNAVQSLNQARIQLREAAQLLREIAEEVDA